MHGLIQNFYLFLLVEFLHNNFGIPYNNHNVVFESFKSQLRLGQSYPHYFILHAYYLVVLTL